MNPHISSFLEFEKRNSFSPCHPFPEDNTSVPTLRTIVSDDLHPGWGVHTTSASSFPLGPMVPFSGDTENAPRFAHEKAAVALPSLIRVRGYRSVDSRLPAGNCREKNTR